MLTESFIYTFQQEKKWPSLGNPLNRPNTNEKTVVVKQKVSKMPAELRINAYIQVIGSLVKSDHYGRISRMNQITGDLLQRRRELVSDKRKNTENHGIVCGLFHGTE
jgi:hypothetical protein